MYLINPISILIQFKTGEKRYFGHTYLMHLLAIYLLCIVYMLAGANYHTYSYASHIYTTSRRTFTKLWIFYMTDSFVSIAKCQKLYYWLEIQIFDLSCHNPEWCFCLWTSYIEMCICNSEKWYDRIRGYHSRPNWLPLQAPFII